MFDYHLLDMVEFGVSDYKGIMDFKESWGLGSKPCFIIAGEQWSSDATLGHISNLLLDFFRGEVISVINLSGIDRVIILSVDEKSLIQFRHYAIKYKKSGSKIPKVVLEEIGPHFDLKVRRTRLASADHRALATPKVSSKKKGNVGVSDTGDTVGKLYIPNQDLSQLVTRKVKALKVGAIDKAVAETSIADNGEVVDETAVVESNVKEEQ